MVEKKIKYKLFLFLICGLFLMSFASSMLEVNKEVPELRANLISEGLIVSDSAMEYPAISIRDNWDVPLLSKEKANLVLMQHTSECGIDCMSEFQITTFDDSPLVDDIKFYRLDEGQREERNIRSYQFQYYEKVIDYESKCYGGDFSANGTEIFTCENIEVGSHEDWINYNVGDVLPAGTYDVKLIGQKAPYMQIDWVMKTQNKIISDWATWGIIGNTSQVIDYSGYGNTGTLINNPIVNSTYAKFGYYGVYFNGTNQYINTSIYNSTLNSQNPFAVSFWIKKEYSATSEGILGRHNTVDGQRDFGFAVNTSGNIEFRMQQNGNATTINIKGKNISDNNWYYIVGQFNGTHLLLSVDNISSTPVLMNFPNSGSNLPLTLGRYLGSTNTSLKGSVDEVRVFNRTLTPSEVSSLYSLNNISNNSGLILYYDMTPYAEAEVILNSPSNGATVYTTQVNQSASANITNGAYLVNATLYDNSTGSWGARNTTSYTGFNGIVAYYTFDETSGTIAYDSLKLKNGTNQGAAINTTGKINTGYYFGGNDWVNTSLNISNNFTYSAWIYSETLPTAGQYEAVVSSGDLQTWVGVKSDGLIRVHISSAGTAYVETATGVITNGEWYNIIVTWNGTGAKVYVNGVEKAITVSGTLVNPTNGNFFIGRRDSGTANYFLGYIDEVAVFNTPISSDYVSSIYNSGAGARPLGLSYDTKTFTNTYSSGSKILWNYKFCDSDGACGFAPKNFTFSIDSAPPAISLNYPTSLINYGAINGTLNLSITVTDTNLDKVWYDYNGTNVTASCTSGVLSSNSITLSNKKNVTIYANDTAGNLNATTFVWDYRVFENSRTENSSTYETAYETYSINLTTNSSLTSISIDYNGTEFPMVNTNDGIWSYSRDLPTTTLGNNTIRYKFTYAGNSFYSYSSYQYVNNTIFTLCNSSYPTKFINFTFKDENTLASLNATMQSATWTYYLGTGTQTKSYTYTTSANASNYSFCGYPNQTIYASPSITYLTTGYPARFYTPGVLTLSNITTPTVLYLLNAADGIYVTFLTISQTNTAINAALITISRTISGVVTTLATGTTDSAGAYTVWLNPNYDHTVTASKTGYGTNTQVIRPTQSSYTLTLTSGGNYSYVSDFRGLLWGYYPRTTVSDVSTNFGFNVSSLYSSLLKCKIELLNQDKSVILATGETTASNGSLCSVVVTYTPNSSYPVIKGRLLIDIGDGYQILEEDAYWRRLNYNTTGMTFTDWFRSMNSTNVNLNYFNNDDQHREYTYILLFFLIVMIICAVLNQAGWDVQTQGGMIFLVGILVWIASVPGFLMLSDISPYQFIDQYFISIVYSMFMIGFAARSLS